jgi:hypothetical protein
VFGCVSDHVEEPLGKSIEDGEMKRKVGGEVSEYEPREKATQLKIIILSLMISIAIVDIQPFIASIRLTIKLINVCCVNKHQLKRISINSDIFVQHRHIIYIEPCEI